MIGIGLGVLTLLAVLVAVGVVLIRRRRRKNAVVVQKHSSGMAQERWYTGPERLLVGSSGEEADDEDEVVEGIGMARQGSDRGLGAQRRGSMEKSGNEGDADENERQALMKTESVASTLAPPPYEDIVRTASAVQLR